MVCVCGPSTAAYRSGRMDAGRSVEAVEGSGRDGSVRDDLGPFGMQQREKGRIAVDRLDTHSRQQLAQARRHLVGQVEGACGRRYLGGDVDGLAASQAADGSPQGVGRRRGVEQQLAHLERFFDRALGVLEALGLVAIEQRTRGLPGGHEFDLLAQVAGVADAHVEPLPKERRGLVGGVAAEEDVAEAPPIGDERVELVDRVAEQLGVVRVAEWGDQLADPFGAIGSRGCHRPG